jgi:hypothetical protein
VDNARSSVAVSEGTYDTQKRTMTYLTEAVMNGRRTRWRETTETATGSPRKQIYRFFMSGPDGADFEMMTVTYTRRAD